MTSDAPPPGVGLKTVTDAAAVSALGTVALSCEPLINIVDNALPFHLITEAGTNPAPFQRQSKVRATRSDARGR